MIILRSSYFSTIGRNMINKLVERLEKERIVDWDIVSKIPTDSISISGDLTALKVYLPRNLEFAQYDIDDFLRKIKPHFRTTTVLERDIYVMKLGGSLNVDQCFKLVKYIIDLEGFCAIVEL